MLKPLVVGNSRELQCEVHLLHSISQINNVAGPVSIVHLGYRGTGWDGAVGVKARASKLRKALFNHFQISYPQAIRQ